jgi:hypothetical protein
MLVCGFACHIMLSYAGIMFIALLMLILVDVYLDCVDQLLWHQLVFQAHDRDLILVDHRLLLWHAVWQLIQLPVHALDTQHTIYLH